MIILKILILILVLVLLIFPFLPLHWIFSYSNYASPRVSKRRNFIHVIVMAGLAIICVVLMPTLRELVLRIGSWKPIQWIISKIPVYAAYTTDLAITIFINLIYCFVSFLVLLVVCGGENLVERLKRVPKEAREQKKKLKKSLKQKVSDAEEDAQKKKQTRIHATDAPLDSTLPPELLPEPEAPLTSNKVILPGAVVEKKKKKRRKKPSAATAQPEPKEPQGLAKLWTIVRNWFYETKEDKWYVRPQTKHVARHLRNFLLLVGTLYVLIFLLLMIPALFHVKTLEEGLYKALQFFVAVNYLYPALGLPVLVLIYGLADGKTVPVVPTTVAESSQLQKGRIVDLDQVEASLMKTCGKDFEVLSFYSSDVESRGVDRVVVDLPENSLIRSVADYVRSQGLELNQEYLLGVKCFTEGKNVLFHAPLYTAVGVYLYAALNLRLMQGERILVICHNRSQIDNYIERMHEGFLSLTRTHKPLWKIASRKNLSREVAEDILVLTPEDFQDEQLYSIAESFFLQTTVVLLPDANQVVSANNYYCQVIAQRLHQYCKSTLQYLFLTTRTILNLDNALTEFFLLNEKPVYIRGDYSYGDVHIYVWRAKEEGAVILDNAARAMPLEVFISNVANQFGITEPNLISDSAIYSNQVNPHWLDIYDAAKRPLGFAIVADDSFNLPSVIHAYARYIGKKASVLHVISRPYLLRNYFYAHAARYLYEQPLLERSMVEHAKQDKTDMVLLLCRLMEGIPVASFLQEMKRMKQCPEDQACDFAVISALANRCLAIAIGHEPEDTQEHFTLYEPENVFYPQLHIRIREDYDVLTPLMEETELIQLRFSNGSRKPVFVNLFKRMLNQRYLLGQNLIYANQNYEIKRIDRAAGIIEVDDASSVHGLARDYVQLRNYRLLNSAVATDCRESGPNRRTTDPLLQVMRKEYAGEENVAVAMVMLRSEESFRIRSDTYGYYIIQADGKSLRVTDKSIPVIRLDENTRESLAREVSAGVYLRLEIKRSRDDRLTMTVAALIQEMLKTLFPECYFCLSVCPILANPSSIYGNEDFKSRTIAQLYPRLENWGEVCENSIELLFVDDCVGGSGALNQIFEPEGTFLQNILWMLSDYLDWQKENEPSPYIFFGMDEQPAVFDLDGTRTVLQSFARDYVREHDINRQIEDANRCFICDDYLDEPILWKDRHMICQDCGEEYVPDPDEAEQILAYARNYLEDSFSITLPVLALRVEGSLPEDVLSALDYADNTILMTSELPLRAVHVQIIRQLVRCWQLTNLDITGDLLIDGQCLYVTLQYLRYLKQFQYAQHLHRMYLLGKDDACQGYCSLVQGLQAEGHENSFLYLLQQSKKTSVTPVKKFTKKRSTRVPGEAKVRYYYRSALTVADAAIYDAILACMMEHRLKLDLSDNDLSQEQLDRIFHSVMGDHPEIFWSNGGCIKYISATGKVDSIELQYTLTFELRAQVQKEIDDAIAPFLSEITDDMEDYEVALKLYECIIKLLDYDTIALERQKRQSTEERVENMDELRNIYGAIVRHKSVCAGYARAYQYLLQLFGIESLYVLGDCFEGGTHAWNIVSLEGDYYHMDVTWGDYSNTDPSKDREGMSYAFFAVTDEQIRQSRSIWRDPTPPKCTSDNCNYFVRNGLCFTKFDAEQINAVLIERFRDPVVRFVELRFSNQKLLRDAEFLLCKNGGIFDVLRKAGRETKEVSHVAREDLCLLRIVVKA